MVVNLDVVDVYILAKKNGNIPQSAKKQ